MTIVENLFAKASLFEFLRGRREALKENIRRFNRNDMMEASLDYLAPQLVARYRVEPVVLGDRVEIVAHGKKQVDATGYPLWRGVNRGECYSATVPFIVFAISFEGNPEVFRHPPCQGSWTPLATIGAGELQLEVNGLRGDATVMRAEFDLIHKRIREDVERGTKEIARFNESLERITRSALEARRDEFLKEFNHVEALGLPVREQESDAKTHGVDLPRHIGPAPAAHGRATRSEPVITMDVYERSRTRRR